jgi:hypothetical protein
MVGQRVSAVGYDFVDSTLVCSGKPGITGSITCEIILPSDSQNNPFLHRFHPDHDNLKDDFLTKQIEAYEITRNLKLTFSDRYPANPDEPERSKESKPLGWGDTQLGGTFSETITGLHKKTLSVAGWFTMNRVGKPADLKP